MSTATTYNGACSSRKSLLRPRTVNTLRRKFSTSVLSNSPGGIRAEKRTSMSLSRVLRPPITRSRPQPASRPGRREDRCMNSRKAGRMKDSGRNCRRSSWPVMKIRHISSVDMRLARPAARKAPELTPTYTSRRARSRPSIASSSARSAPSSYMPPIGPPPAIARPIRARVLLAWLAGWICSMRTCVESGVAAIVAVVKQFALCTAAEIR